MSLAPLGFGNHHWSSDDGEHHRKQSDAMQQHALNKAKGPSWKAARLSGDSAASGGKAVMLSLIHSSPKKGVL
jgi:hypothetical protein